MVFYPFVGNISGTDQVTFGNYRSGTQDVNPIDRVKGGTILRLSPPTCRFFFPKPPAPSYAKSPSETCAPALRGQRPALAPGPGVKIRRQRLATGDDELKAV